MIVRSRPMSQHSVVNSSRPGGPRDARAPVVPALTRKTVAPSVRTAAADLLKASQGNDVSIATYKASPSQLAAFAKNKTAFSKFLQKTAMQISNKVPHSEFASQSLKPFTGDAAKAIYEFAQVPTFIPETAKSRALHTRAKADAKVLADALKKTGGQLYVVNWNNQDDTDVNILVAVNKASGELTFVKTFPAI